MVNKIKQSKKAKCQKCGYEWITASDHVYVSCPSCMSKVKIKEDKENENTKIC